jgi:hypothetical protein
MLPHFVHADSESYVCPETGLSHLTPKVATNLCQHCGQVISLVPAGIAAAKALLELCHPGPATAGAVIADVATAVGAFATEGPRTVQTPEHVADMRGSDPAPVPPAHEDMPPEPDRPDGNQGPLSGWHWGPDLTHIMTPEFCQRMQALEGQSERIQAALDRAGLEVLPDGEVRVKQPPIPRPDPQPAPTLPPENSGSAQPVAADQGGDR